MNKRGIAVMAAVGLFALPTLAGAAPNLAATGVRIGDHPAFVRVVVDFNGRVRARDVEASRFAPRMAAVRLVHPGVTTQTNGGRGNGVRVALQPGTQMLHITTSFTRNRFKYLSYAVVTGNRLAIDLWKSAPPAGATQTCPARLTLRTVQVSPGVVAVTGTEHAIFENQFEVLVRGAHGKALGRKHVFGPGSWSKNVPYTAGYRQAGTIEAVSFSAKDGSLECLAQARVTLPAS
jgi:hypothetical protein